ncbi:hypothetical protein AX14_010638 [Amanita brunnescens Koide BX004]|nr:hypothetical protein AX14_010638 [Amanita brunnescens Koide BX004]
MAQGFRDDIRELRHRAERIDQRMEQIDEKVDGLKDQVNRMEQMSAVAYNRGCRRGAPSVLKVVPFKDGKDPTQLRQGALPLLSDVRDINNLSSVQLRAYYRGYYPDREMRNYSDEERRAAVKAAIGCLE